MNDSRTPGDDQLDALFSLARAHRPDTSRYEFAFETRLLARLQTPQEAGSVWALVTWRMVPIFALCMIGLTLWEVQSASELDTAAQVASLENPTTLDASGNVQL
ncbi:MAG: hypothetical protein LV479_01430 [Methylacidiphilales bacterium]|nr:hypothetical protein [Candidatus Methylacidiphilales bacterium]